MNIEGCYTGTDESKYLWNSLSFAGLSVQAIPLKFHEAFKARNKTILW